MIERGHIYIAQPPLYKIKHGKKERYVKDDHELKQYILGLALADAELYTEENKPPLTGDTLEKIATEYILAESVIERMSRVTDNGVMHALLHHPEIDLSNQDKAIVSANSLETFTQGAKISAEYDEANERYRLRIDRVSHGNLNTSYLDQDFLHSGDYAQIKKTYQVFDGLFKTGASIKRGEKQRSVDNFKQALEWLLEDAKKGLSINRYKGLGEMNPDQLWETTMDPANRRLLRTQIEDSIQTDEIFTTLMGDVVEPRRAFIENNALSATNIDV